MAAFDKLCGHVIATFLWNDFLLFISRHFKTGRDDHGVDLDCAKNLQHELFQLLNKKQLHRLMGRLFSCFHASSKTNYPSVECLRCFMFLIVSDLLNVPRQCALGIPIARYSEASGHSDGGNSSGGADISGAAGGANACAPSSYTADTGDDGPYLTVEYAPLNSDLFLHELAKAITKLEPAPFKIFGNAYLTVLFFIA